MVRTAGLEPAWPKADRFSYPYGFRRDTPLPRVCICGLDYPFTLAAALRAFALGAARLVSTPSRSEVSVWAWLGIAISRTC
mgnify:CR=1